MDKPVLKMQRKVCQEISYREFEDFVNKCYGFSRRSFNFNPEPVYPKIVQMLMDERLKLSCKDILTDDDKNRLKELNAAMDELTENGKISISSLAVPQPKVKKPVEYSFVATEECGNDSEHSFSPDGQIDDYDLDNAAKIRSGEDVPAYCNHLLFNCLVADGYLEPGEYTVNVSW